MATRIDLSIVIVTYNSSIFIKECIGSLLNQSDLLKKEIIVIDNASSDDTAKIIKFNFPAVNLLQNYRNLGFAKANNHGAKVSQGKYILFLNPDTIIQNATLEKMIQFMEINSDAGIIGPKLLYPDGSLQFSCRQFYTVRAILMRRTFLGKLFPNSKSLKNHLMSDWNHNTIKDVDWVLGACLMIRRDILEKAGYFDEKYKIYFEDVDLCYRVKKLGYKVYYFPEATAIHYHQRESAKKLSMKTIWHILSAIRFFNKFGWKF